MLPDSLRLWEGDFCVCKQILNPSEWRNATLQLSAWEHGLSTPPTHVLDSLCEEETETEREPETFFPFLETAYLSASTAEVWASQWNYGVVKCLRNKSVKLYLTNVSVDN